MNAVRTRNCNKPLHWSGRVNSKLLNPHWPEESKHLLVGMPQTQRKTRQTPSCAHLRFLAAHTLHLVSAQSMVPDEGTHPLAWSSSPLPRQHLDNWSPLCESGWQNLHANWPIAGTSHCQRQGAKGRTLTPPVTVPATSQGNARETGQAWVQQIALYPASDHSPSLVHSRPLAN